MRSTEELLNLGLPKWPLMYVTGAPVTPEQAKEIIRRTDPRREQGISDEWIKDWAAEKGL